jgi:hypothetical protein
MSLLDVRDVANQESRATEIAEAIRDSGHDLKSEVGLTIAVVVIARALAEAERDGAMRERRRCYEIASAIEAAYRNHDDDPARRAVIASIAEIILAGERA